MRFLFHSCTFNILSLCFRLISHKQHAWFLIQCDNFCHLVTESFFFLQLLWLWVHQFVSNIFCGIFVVLLLNSFLYFPCLLAFNRFLNLLIFICYQLRSFKIWFLFNFKDFTDIFQKFWSYSVSSYSIQMRYILTLFASMLTCMLFLPSVLITSLFITKI